MKYYISLDEMYPVYYLDKQQDTVHRFSAELTPEEVKNYEEAMTDLHLALNSIQDKLVPIPK